MPVLEIIIYPDKRLKEVCAPVDEIDEETRELINDMVETMYDAPGVGLAAPQVGVLQRIIVVDANSGDNEESPSKLYKLINPEIINFEGEIESEEGCLSIPGIREAVKRFEKISVKALDENGKEIVIEAEDFLAIVLQHEMDHLNGVLFIDHLSRLKQQLVKSKIKKQLSQT